MCGLILDAFGRKDKGDNQSVETQNFGEDEDKDHAYKQPRLLCCAADPSVPHDANGKACGQTTETHREASSKVEEGSRLVRGKKMKSKPEKGEV